MVDLTEFRKHLHQFPEVAGQEAITSECIKNFLLAHSPTHLLDRVGGHGLLAIYSFGVDGPSILIRCELDALPIEEPNSFAHRSRHAGVSHKCGHDGHMTMVAGLAPWLQEQSFKCGQVILLFQPAEETGEGAKAMLDDPRMQTVHPDFVFALHNIPAVPLHQVIVVERQFSATVQSLAFRFKGQQSHAAEPENGRNPAMAMAELTQFTRQLTITDPKDPGFALITPVYTIMGQKEYGISAGYGELHFTLRTWSIARMKQLVARLKQQTEMICDRYQLTYEAAYFDYFPATVNARSANEIIARSSDRHGLEICQKEVPFKFGEDFGWFTQKYTGAMFGLGSGENTPVLHNDFYDFPDDLITSGIAMFQGIIEEILEG